MKNYALYSFLITVLVIFLLLPLYFLPTFKIGNFSLKKIDLLSDIRIKKNINPENSFKGVLLKNKEQNLIQQRQEDDCKEGLVCIKDFSPQENILSNFFEALNQANNRNVRIAFFGDSFIEGDILTSHLRNFFQHKFGGKGVGFMPISTNISTGFRRTIKHYAQGFASYSLIDKSYCSSYLGISGSYFCPEQNPIVTYQGVKYLQHLDSITMFRLMYINKENDIETSCSINNGHAETLLLNKGEGVQILTKKRKINKITLHIPDSTHIYLLGAFLDDSIGVSLDNFGMRSHSGMGLRNIPRNTLRQTDSLLHYDLIILEYGLNVVQQDRSNYDDYKKQMIAVINYLKSTFPKAGIILMSVGDRSCKENGEYITMPGVVHMIDAQQEIAQKAGVAFWSMFDAMGGLNSMNNWVNANPPKAAKDYTHISAYGGWQIANVFFQSLMYQKEKYETNKNAR